MEKKLLFCLGLCFLCLSSGVVGVVIPYWLYVSFDNEVWHEGLWKVCGGTLCVQFSTGMAY